MTPLGSALAQPPVRDLFAHLARHSGLPPRTVLANLAGNTTRAQWLSALQIRRWSIYLSVVALNQPQATVAHALNLRRQTIHRLVRITEDERDNPAIDAFLDAVTLEINP